MFRPFWRSEILDAGIGPERFNPDQAVGAVHEHPRRVEPAGSEDRQHKHKLRAEMSEHARVYGKKIFVQEGLCFL